MREPRADFQLASFRSCSGGGVERNLKLHPPVKDDYVVWTQV
jgi:hypothetical protein